MWQSLQNETSLAPAEEQGGAGTCDAGQRDHQLHCEQGERPMNRRTAHVLGLVALGWAAGAAGDTVQHADRTSNEGQITTTPLREFTTVSFSQGRWIAWLQPARCDDVGNIFLILVPEAKRRDLTTAKGPTDILRISADGKNTSLLKVSDAPVLADADEVSTFATATNASGTVFAGVWAARGETGSYYIISFDKTGHYRSAIELDPEQIFVSGLEVFGSGAFLLQGVRRIPEGEPRITIMSATGSLNDVVTLPRDAAKEAVPIKGAAHVARGGDGLLYFVHELDNAIHVIDPSGDSRLAFNVPPTPPNRQLVELKAAGTRLATIYYEEHRSGNQSGRFWINVYDSVLGEQVAAYGPVSSPPLCYQYEGSQDRFTLMKDGNTLAKLSP